MRAFLFLYIRLFFLSAAFEFYRYLLACLSAYPSKISLPRRTIHYPNTRGRGNVHDGVYFGLPA